MRRAGSVATTWLDVHPGISLSFEHLAELVGKARQVNDRLLMIERVGQGCAIGSALFERIHQPYNSEGQRAGAPRFGDQRAMALAGCLCMVVHAVTGFTNKSLRGLVAGLLGSDYTASQMSYDLRRLRLHGLISRVPGSNTYVVTPEGTRVAVFYTNRTTGSSGRSSTLIDLPHLSSYFAPSAPSSASWVTTSTTLVSGQPPETLSQGPETGTPRSARGFALRSNREDASISPATR